MNQILDQEEPRSIGLSIKYKWSRRIYAILYLMLIAFLLATIIILGPRMSHLDQYASALNAIDLLKFGSLAVALAFFMGILGLLKSIRLHKYILILGGLHILILVIFVLVPAYDFIIDQFIEMGGSQDYLK